ncbi:MAG: hypothetical protein DI629_03965 [Mesorhizobium amorphae]|nr:MAG: hypothetical protein DI629_03965 [Mesorhizobium amorphae]
MTLPRPQLFHVLASVLRAAFLLLALAAPVLATVDPQVAEGVIEAPKQQKGGIGFVLLVSLQRA